MQMISAAKLKRAQEAALASRPYVEKLVTLTQNIAPKKAEMTVEPIHPYLQSSGSTGKTLYVIISPDKGLCGGLVTNLIREYFKLEHKDASYFITIGKKIESPIASTSKQLVASFPFGNVKPSYDTIFPIIEVINDYFLNRKVHEVTIITTHFNTVFSQKIKISQLLPVRIDEVVDSGYKGDVRLFEPTPAQLLPPLLQRYVEMQLYQALLESYASEQAARMMAMQNATDNAKDIVNALQLLYNKARQEKITKEILDISSAAIAMEGQE